MIQKYRLKEELYKYSLTLHARSLLRHHRAMHLVAAIRHMDEESEELARKCNAPGQEETIEQTEALLLRAGSIEGSTAG
jgi:hypothetical protein